MRGIFKLALLIVVLLIAPSAMTQTVATEGDSEKATLASEYVCPMHPEESSTKPGRCPKCGMELRLKTAANTPPNSAIDTADRERNDLSQFSSSRIPNARVQNQDGKAIDFLDDLVKGRTVAINFIFTTCTTICPPLTATFRRIQTDMEKRGLKVQLISISVDPLTDTPERLHEFASKFRAGPGWEFVTGEKSTIESLLNAFGAAVADKNDHTPMIFIGNDQTGFWTRTYGLSSPAVLEQLIEGAAAMK